MPSTIAGRVRAGPTAGVELPAEVQVLPSGNVLVVDVGYWTNTGSEIVEVDRLGNIVWSFAEGLRCAHSAKLLDNSHFIIADTYNNRLLEVSREKGLVWECSRLNDGTSFWYPNDVTPTPDGTFLVSDRNHNRLVEIDRRGRVRWEYNELDHPHHAELTDDGTILVANSGLNRVEEISRQGRLLWCYGDGSPLVLNWPRSVELTADGTFLITDSRNHRVIEVTRQGELVWSLKTREPSRPYTAHRLPNGNVILSDQLHSRVLEMDRFGNIVWMWRNFWFTQPVQERVVNPGFEQVDDASGWAAGWLPCTLLAENRGELHWDSETAFAGRASVRLEQDGGGRIWVQQTLGVRANRLYRFRGAIKGRGITGFAQLQCAFRNSEGGMIYHSGHLPGSRLLTSDFDWSLEEGELQAPPGATAVDVRLTLCGPGTVWYDEIGFAEVT